jgi:uncharacterized protein YoxC
MLPHCRVVFRLLGFVKCMSSDPFMLPEIWSDLPKGDAPEGGRAGFVANARGGFVLIEEAGVHAQSDSPPAVRPLDRAEQAPAAGPAPDPASAALAKGLSDLTEIVTQAEALLRAQGTLKGDVHFAVERIHDVALALRMHDVNAALCDTLEASVREVGDAVVRHEAAATGALSAAALLGDIMHRIEQLIRVVAEPPARTPLADATSAADIASVLGTGASPALGTTMFAAGTAFDARRVDPLPLLREAEQAAASPASPVASQAPGAVAALPVAVETSVDHAREQPHEFGAGSAAYLMAGPLDDKIDPPPIVRLDAEPKRDLGFREPAPAATTVERAVTEEAQAATSDAAMSAGAASAEILSDAGHVRAWLDVFSDQVMADNDSFHQRPPPVDADHARAVPTERPTAAWHLQNEINISAEIVAAESVPAEMAAVGNGFAERPTAATVAAATVAAETVTAEAVPAETVAAETIPVGAVAVEAVAAETVPAETVPAETVPVETLPAKIVTTAAIAAENLATETVAAEVVAAEPKDDLERSAHAAVVVERAPATMTVGESGSGHVAAPASAGNDATAPALPVRPSTSDPFAAFYGLSEEELIALFS